MPEESKKSQQKGKNDPKEQRRRRQGRQPPGAVEKKPEKQSEQSNEKQSKDLKQPTYEQPGPEFYKNLKRETDEILKITEEANSKYKKKEIQSNWAKYEMPIESYDEIDEQESIGADYEKLIQAPSSAGGHFQFKHEKSWDTDSGPSLYDKYFNINMDLLSLAISTIPFYERNNLDVSMFHENDIMTMDHRATKFKQKYYNDKKYSTPELESQEKILRLISPATPVDENGKDNICKSDENGSSEKSVENDINLNIDNKIVEAEHLKKEFVLGSQRPLKEETEADEFNFKPSLNNITALDNNIKDKDDDSMVIAKNENNDIDDENNKLDIIFAQDEAAKKNKLHEEEVQVNKNVSMTKEQPKNPVIESPEDLEKWLDDFLDG